MEAIILAGGKGERLGDAAAGRPKSLVDVAGRPLAAYQIGRLARAGVNRVIMSCALDTGELFEEELGGLGVEIVTAEEPERLGRGGGIKFAARMREETGDVYALNGDELVDVAQPKSPFGVVDLGDDDVVLGFSEAGRIPYWVNCGIYVLSAEAIDRFPDIGDHETTTFPELVLERRLHAYRHQGLWLTVNTPKELRTAGEQVASHPEWLA
jgi:NDP-sugar pyrophosphorylase family protein